MESLEECLWRLDAAYNVMMDEQALMDRVCDQAVAALGRIVRDNFPSLANWRSEQLRELDGKIYRIVCSFAEDLTFLEAAGLRKD